MTNEDSKARRKANTIRYMVNDALWAEAEKRGKVLDMSPHQYARYVLATDALGPMPTRKPGLLDLI